MKEYAAGDYTKWKNRKDAEENVEEKKEEEEIILVHEQPVYHQIYEYIKSFGSTGVTQTVCLKRLSFVFTLYIIGCMD